MNLTRNTLLAIAGRCLIGLTVVTGIHAGTPPAAGLKIWLDASDTGTVERTLEGRVLKSAHKSGHGHDAVNSKPASHARLIAGATNGKSVIRFGGDNDGLEIQGSPRTQMGPLALFIVSQRLAAQAGGQPWQRLLSSHDGVTTNDLLAHNVRLLAPFEQTHVIYAARVDDREYSDAWTRTGPDAPP